MTFQTTTIDGITFSLPSTSKGKCNVAKSSIYTKAFFERSHRSAATAIVPLVLELIRPTSVIDVGCGNGEFLDVFQEHGVGEILGIDGDYIDRNLLFISQENFRALDISIPFTLDKTYDLTLCLEVAEHIAPEKASDLIESLTRLAPVVLFSAAIPFQDGTHHVNEQWPEYWAQLFRARGFVPVDALRKKIWNDRQIEYWYRQNIMFFCTEQALESNNVLSREFSMTNPDALSMVHPEWYMECNTKYLRKLREVLGHIEPLWRIKNKTRKLLGK